ncbi:MAG: hypothetical protein GY701_32865 [Sulfitobacter sp.]|nr:hypothetical protein [Sulfitobacter sp.]
MDLCVDRGPTCHAEAVEEMVAEPENEQGGPVGSFWRRIVRAHGIWFTVLVVAALLARSLWYTAIWWVLPAVWAATVVAAVLWLVRGSRRLAIIPVIGGTLLAGTLGVGQDLAFSVSETCLTEEAEGILEGGPTAGPSGCRLARFGDTRVTESGSVVFVGSVPAWNALGLDEVGLVYVPGGTEALHVPSGTDARCLDVDRHSRTCSLTPLGDHWFRYKVHVEWNP